MSGVEEHYSSLLADHYTWMFGTSFEAKVAEQRAILEDALAGASRGLAVDLGSGPGFQTIALAEMGYSPVVAMDTSAELLEELLSHRASHDVRVVHGDMLRVGEFVGLETDLGLADVMVCMGDTITHLQSKEDVLRLLHAVRGCAGCGWEICGELSGFECGGGWGGPIYSGVWGRGAGDDLLSGVRPAGECDGA